jgi:hypothetical protein
MKVQLLFLFILCPAVYSLGQVSIRGRVTDGRQNLTFATVSLLTSDSALIKNVVTSDDGHFAFENVAHGNYLVSSSMVGYNKYYSKLVTVRNSSIEIPEIVLYKGSTELSGVTVKSKKPLFEQKMDRMVVNVQSSITSAGSTVLEVLEKSPGIVVNKQNNTITMNGKTGVRVMINGKSSQLPLDVVVQMLEGMSSANVERIELITNPPAKYDAEGSAGIINIIMKGDVDLGTNGSFGLTLGAKWAEVYGGHVNVNHRDKNFACFLDYSITSEHNLHKYHLSRQFLFNGFVQEIDDYSRRENTTVQQNANAGIEFKLSKNVLLNFSFTGYRRNWDMNAVINDISHISKDSTLTSSTAVHESNIWQSASAGMGLQTKLNSNTDINFNLDYLYYHNHNPSQYVDLSSNHNNSNDGSQVDVKKTTPIQFLIATVDYKHVYSPVLTMEAGLKASTSTLDNNVLVQRLKNNTWVTDSIFTSNSNFDEQVGAAYVSTRWQPGNQWTINSGLRCEYTHTTIGTPTQKNLVNRKGGYLFPNLSFEKGLAKNQSVELSYSRRINRPTYNEIAPFVIFWGPNSFDGGNTQIQASIADAAKIGYHKNKWVISLQFTHSKHEIDLGEPDNDSSNNVIYRAQNLKYLNQVTLANAWAFNITNWWEVQTNVVAQYLFLQTEHLPINVQRHNCEINLNVTNSLKLPRDFAVEISGMYQSRTLRGVIESLPVSSLNVGIQKKLGKGTMRFAIDDIFNTNNWRLKMTLPQDKNLSTFFHYDFHSRFARITYTRSFGNSKLKSIKLKSASEEERGRVAN